MSEFTDRVRMEVIPEIEARGERGMALFDAFLRPTRSDEYRDGFVDGQRTMAEILEVLLDDMDAVDMALDGEGEHNG